MLSPGTRLGPYEVVSPLGAGGMGEVYRAHDTRLGRDVAVKVLPEFLSSDGERLRRFESEARAVAALSHANILSLYDVGAHGSVRYLVTELLEGESLRLKLAGGALGLRRTTDYALQLAYGLAAAHDKGIIHRDLKPENIFISRDGRLKILDFGLARQEVAHADAAGSSATHAAAAPDTRTADGIVLGTVGYMSPEQVRGERADQRSDIFAFGTVLFEMLTGCRAFARGTSVETMTAILREEPSEIASTADRPVPPAYERIVRRCLEKDPEQRFQSARDLAFALEAVSGSTSTSAPAVSPPPAPRTWLRTLGVAAAAVLALAAAAFAIRLMGVGAQSTPARLQRVTYQRGYVKGARFTTDGTGVIYSAMWDGRPYEVFSARIGDRAARPLDLKDAMVVGVADDGDLLLLTKIRRIRTTNWMQAGTLARAPASGGAAREILDDVWDADISRDGRQMAVVRTPNGPHQLEYPVGHVLYTTNGYIDHPRISPDGRTVAFFDHPVFADSRGYVAVAGVDGKTRRLTEEHAGEDGLAWSPDGREIWFGGTVKGEQTQQRMVLAVTLQGKTREVVQLPGDVTVMDIAPDGRLLLSHDEISSSLMVASPADAPERDVSVLGYASYGALSDDGKAVAFTESGASDDYLVYFRRLDDPYAVNLGDGSAMGITPDGKYVVAQVPSQPTKIRILPTGAGEARTFDVAPVNVDRYFVSWMPGDREFVFLGHEGVTAPHAYVAALSGGPARPLTRQPGAHFWNRVSPDGRYVLQGPGVAQNWNVSPELVDLKTGEVRPAPVRKDDGLIDWDREGRHIYVVQEAEHETTLLKVDVATGERSLWKTIRPADPAGVLSTSRFFVTPSGGAYTYTVTRVLSCLYVYTSR